ncbi:hypothetical protein U0070_024861, partial [Myodes glareolus]
TALLNFDHLTHQALPSADKPRPQRDALRSQRFHFPDVLANFDRWRRNYYACVVPLHGELSDSRGCRGSNSDLAGRKTMCRASAPSRHSPRVCRTPDSCWIRDYVIADSDEMSAKKIVSFEDARKRDSATEVRDHVYKLQVVHQVQLSLKRIPWYFSALPTIGNKMGLKLTQKILAPSGGESSPWVGVMLEGVERDEGATEEDEDELKPRLEN